MSTPETLQPAPETAPKGLSEPERVINTFIAPSKTMEDIRRNASWWLPFILTAIISSAFFFTIEKKVGFDQVVANQIAQSAKAQEQMDKMPPDQRERAMEMRAKGTKFFTIYLGWIFGLIAAVIVAAVLMATFNFGLGAEVKFKTALAIVMFSWLPSIARALLGIITLFAGSDPEAFNLNNPVATNLAAFMTPGQHPFLYGMGQMIDIVSIWIVFLLALGFAKNSKVKTGTAFGVVLGWYVLVSVVGAGIAAAFS